MTVVFSFPVYLQICWVDFSVVWQVWVYLRRSRPPQRVTWTNRTEEVQQDMECPFCFCFVSLFCWKGGKFLHLAATCKKKSFWQRTKLSLHKQHYVTMTKTTERTKNRVCIIVCDPHPRACIIFTSNIINVQSVCCNMEPIVSQQKNN